MDAKLASGLAQILKVRTPLKPARPMSPLRGCVLFSRYRWLAPPAKLCRPIRGYACQARNKTGVRLNNPIACAMPASGRAGKSQAFNTRRVWSAPESQISLVGIRRSQSGTR